MATIKKRSPQGKKAAKGILSKSRLLAFRQCPKRLWLEMHRPELRADSPAVLANFATGNMVGNIARLIYDPNGKGELLDPQTLGFEVAMARTQELLQSNQPIFEAGFRASGAMALADVLLPVKKGSKRGWRMIEVKSSTSVKDYHKDDAAVQAFVARASGLPLFEISLAHIDSSWIYPGNENYTGLLLEKDLTDEAFDREKEVKDWITAAQRIAASNREPKVTTGKHCSQPYECGFRAYCESAQKQAHHPIEWLPGARSKALIEYIEKNKLTELRDVPDKLLNATQQRVKTATLTGTAYFNRAGAKAALSDYSLPAYFMDFETINFAVPIWKGTRPYQQIPFQFSVHRLSRSGKLDQQAFIDLSGKDPSRGFANALVAAGGERGPIFVYNASFEKSRISELAQRFPTIANALLGLNERIVDLLPIAREHYYHPNQQGSWSIKSVLPALCPDLNYDGLDGVQDGAMAMQAFLESIAPSTNIARKAEIEKQLLKYCALDTYALIRLWSAFTSIIST